MYILRNMAKLTQHIMLIFYIYSIFYSLSARIFVLDLRLAPCVRADFIWNIWLCFIVSTSLRLWAFSLKKFESSLRASHRIHYTCFVSRGFETWLNWNMNWIEKRSGSFSFHSITYTWLSHNFKHHFLKHKTDVWTCSRALGN